MLFRDNQQFSWVARLVSTCLAACPTYSSIGKSIYKLWLHVRVILRTYRTLVAQMPVFCVSALRELLVLCFFPEKSSKAAYASFESWMRPADRYNHITLKWQGWSISVKAKMEQIDSWSSLFPYFIEWKPYVRQQKETKNGTRSWGIYFFFCWVALAKLANFLLGNIAFTCCSSSFSDLFCAWRTLFCLYMFLTW